MVTVEYEYSEGNEDGMGRDILDPSEGTMSWGSKSAVEVDIGAAVTLDLQDQGGGEDTFYLVFADYLDYITCIKNVTFQPRQK